MKRVSSISSIVFVMLLLVSAATTLAQTHRLSGRTIRRLPSTRMEVAAEKPPAHFRVTKFDARKFNISILTSLAQQELGGWKPAGPTMPHRLPNGGQALALPRQTATNPLAMTSTTRPTLASVATETKPGPNKHAKETTKDKPTSETFINPRIDLSKAELHANSADFSTVCLANECDAVDGAQEAFPYDSKHDVPTQHPWIEWGRVWYGDGITPRGIDLFGPYNLVRPKFYMYGDFRTGVASGRNAAGRTDNWANRLNLDLDLQITDSERFHTFVGPLDENNQFTRWELVDGDLRYRNEMDLTPATAFFEGDMGAILGAWSGQSSPFEFPVTAGLVPLLFQNGIWMEDAASGFAFAFPAKHSRLLNWSNFDWTFFALFDQLNSPAFQDDNDAHAYGTAAFIEAYGGYIEAGYAYLHARQDESLSYHNATVSFTRRYFDRLSNSVRVIVNSGQDRVRNQRTADGGLLLVENSLITASPLTVVPYANFFYGWGRPQSVARAGISGGILRNTGINFDTDGVNGFATLDVSAADTVGGSIGIDLIGESLDRQLLLELSYLTPHGDMALANGDQFAVGARYQFPITNATLLRFDAMHGWRENDRDVYGTRMEYRWKF